MQIVNHKAYSVLVHLYVFQVAMDPRLTGKNVPVYDHRGRKDVKDQCSKESQ